MILARFAASTNTIEAPGWLSLLLLWPKCRIHRALRQSAASLANISSAWWLRDPADWPTWPNYNSQLNIGPNYNSIIIRIIIQ